MNGYSILELTFVISLVATLSGVAAPQLMDSIDEYRAAGAARYLSSRLQRIRLESINRSSNVALQVVQVQNGYSYAVYVDGNGDGVKTRDIGNSTDPQFGPTERLADNFPGVDFGVAPGLPPVESGTTAPGTDPIKLGTSNLLSFSPLGTSSSGSLYIRSRRGAQYVIRVLGETGRVRVLKFDPRARAWRPV